MIEIAGSYREPAGDARRAGGGRGRSPEQGRALETRAIRRRPERADDAPFRLELFRQTQGVILAGFEPALIDLLIRQQMAGQAMSYAAAYPDAQHDIVECDGIPIGRMVVAQTSKAVTIVDLALLADRRGQGLGTRLLGDLISTAETAGQSVHLSVDPRNVGARRLYERLGFAVTAWSETSWAMERRAAPAP